MQKSVTWGILKEYTWKDLIKLILIFIIIGHGSAYSHKLYLDWLPIYICWIGFYLWDRADSFTASSSVVFDKNQLPAVFYYLPDENPGMFRYLKAYIHTETLLFCLISILFQIVTVLFQHVFFHDVIVQGFFGVSPILEVLQSVLFVGFLYYLCCSKAFQERSGHRFRPHHPGGRLLHYILLLSNLSGILIISSLEKQIVNHKIIPTRSIVLGLSIGVIFSIIHLLWCGKQMDQPIHCEYDHSPDSAE